MGKFLLMLRTVIFTLCLFEVPVTEAQKCGLEFGESSRCPSSWTSLWYVWLILLTLFLLLLCGVTASCVKCCRRSKPQVPTFPTRPYEVTVIAIDNDSTIHSTVSPNSSLQYINRNGNGLQEASSFILPPPPYSLYAVETPPPYEMALKMAKPIETCDPKTQGENLTRNEEPSPTDETSRVTSSVLP
ncbi:transmembrane protein 52-like [Heterodontus francisci]|uniref:transmembrane protein 52-like n=1 Tax=Heterodontus francisci TaxID=7792 RepID=UPI00355C77B5